MCRLCPTRSRAWLQIFSIDMSHIPRFADPGKTKSLVELHLGCLDAVLQREGQRACQHPNKALAEDGIPDVLSGNDRAECNTNRLYRDDLATSTITDHIPLDWVRVERIVCHRHQLADAQRRSRIAICVFPWYVWNIEFAEGDRRHRPAVVAIDQQKIADRRIEQIDVLRLRAA